MHDAVFDHPKKETAASTKLHSFLKTNENVEILKGAVADDDGKWIDAPWKFQLCRSGARYSNYEGMTDVLSGRMMEELVSIINCVTGDMR